MMFSVADARSYTTTENSPHDTHAMPYCAGTPLTPTPIVHVAFDPYYSRTEYVHSHVVRITICMRMVDAFACACNGSHVITTPDSPSTWWS